MNLLVGERISIITSKAQTTRHRIMGIVNTPEYQIVFSDTPGVLAPKYKLQESMLNFSEGALVDADVLVYVTDVVEDPAKNADYLAKVARENIPVLLVINKIDLVKRAVSARRAYRSLADHIAQGRDISSVGQGKLQRCQSHAAHCRASARLATFLR